MTTGSDTRFYVITVTFRFQPDQVEDLLQEVLERITLHRKASF